MLSQGRRPIPEQITNTVCSCAVERSYSTGKEQWGRCAKATYLELKNLLSFCYVGLSVMHACSHIIMMCTCAFNNHKIACFYSYKDEEMIMPNSIDCRELVKTC